VTAPCNTTQVPNQLIDMMSEIDGFELKILLYLIRHISKDFISTKEISKNLQIRHMNIKISAYTLKEKFKENIIYIEDEGDELEASLKFRYQY